MKLESNPIQETGATWIQEQTRLEGTFLFPGTTRVYGILKGKIEAPRGSTLILMSTSQVEGEIAADHLVIAGFFQGKARASAKIQVESSARVLGDLDTPSIEVEFGAHFEGQINASGSSRKESAPS